MDVARVSKDLYICAFHIVIPIGIHWVFSSNEGWVVPSSEKHPVVIPGCGVALSDERASGQPQGHRFNRTKLPGRPVSLKSETRPNTKVAYSENLQATQMCHESHSLWKT